MWPQPFVPPHPYAMIPMIPNPGYRRRGMNPWGTGAIVAVTVVTLAIVGGVSYAGWRAWKNKQASSGAPPAPGTYESIFWGPRGEFVGEQVWKGWSVRIEKTLGQRGGHFHWWVIDERPFGAIPSQVPVPLPGNIARGDGFSENLEQAYTDARAAIDAAMAQEAAAA